MNVWVQVVIGAFTAVVTGGLAFAGAFVGHRLQYRRWHREETMRLMRWAADKALDPDPVVRGAGVEALFALLDANLLQNEDEDFVRQITANLASHRASRYPEGVELLFGEEGTSDDA